MPLTKILHVQSTKTYIGTRYGSPNTTKLVVCCLPNTMTVWAALALLLTYSCSAPTLLPWAQTRRSDMFSPAHKFFCLLGKIDNFFLLGAGTQTKRFPPHQSNGMPQKSTSVRGIFSSQSHSNRQAGAVVPDTPRQWSK